MTLADALADWTDLDGALFELGVVLGLFAPGHDEYLKHKGVLWSENPVRSALGEILKSLERAGILEYRDDADLTDYQYRWLSQSQRP